MQTEKMRIKLKAYDHKVLENAVKKIVETIKRSGGNMSGPVPLPTEIEMRTHKRLIDVKKPSKETVEALTHLDLPSGVNIEIKMI